MRKVTVTIGSSGGKSGSNGRIGGGGGGGGGTIGEREMQLNGVVNKKLACLPSRSVY